MMWFARIALLVFAMTVAPTAMAQKVPKDFKLDLLAGGVHQQEPGAELDTNKVSISADGTVSFNRWISPYGDLPASQVKLGKKQMRSIMKALKKYRVFDFDDTYINYRIAGGDTSQLALISGGKTKSIRVENLLVEDFKALIYAINDVLPPQRSILTTAMISNDRDTYPVVPR